MEIEVRLFLTPHCGARFIATLRKEPKVCAGIMSLGDLYIVDSADPELQPRLVESLRGLRVHELAAGFQRTLILTGSGEAQSVTHTVDQLSGLDGQLAQVAFGGSHMLALTRTGQVYTLGDGSLGQLGHGAAVSCAEPRLLSQLASKVVAQVVCGQSHSMALTDYGDVFSWGRGFEGQLGLGAQEVTLCPKYVHTFAGTPIAQLAAGGNHSAALSGAGLVYCWGEALSGQVGTGRKSSVGSPVQIEGLPPCKAISCGFNHTTALGEAGQMYSWGVASHGPTAEAPAERFVPQLLPASEEAPLAQVASGGRGSVVLTHKGEVFTWVPAAQAKETQQQPPAAMMRVDALSHLTVSRVATSGQVLLAFVEAAITHVSPGAAPVVIMRPTRAAAPPPQPAPPRP